MPIALALFSCNEGNYDMGLIENQTTDSAVIETSRVTTDEVSQVATSFFRKMDVPETRSSSYEISQIYDDSGNISMYVVNFANDGGFVIVSATKNFNPILAYSETGNYDVNGLMPPGLYQWQSEMSETVNYADELPADSTTVYRNMWSEYLPQETVQQPSQAATRAIVGDMVQAQLILQDSVMAWNGRQGYTVLQITGSITGDKKIDEAIRDWAKGGIYPPYQEEWERLSLVLRRPKPVTNVKNFMQSTWGQRKNYNEAFDRINGTLPPAGCGPVALGQIMRYYEYPSYFNWDAMPYDEASHTTSVLLHDIAIKANAEISIDGTGTTDNDIQKALQSYGYKCDGVSNHKASKAFYEIERKHPVYMAGTLEGIGDGHAWVASGGSYTTSEYYYYLYTLRERIDFSPIYQYSEPGGIPIYYFYMNWGWYGDYNGNYLEGSPAPSSYGEITERKDIYGITPNN